MDSKILTIARLAKALGEETRLRLLDLLLGHEFCGRAMAARLGITEAAVSQHLRVLKRAGLVEAERRGRFRHYRVRRKALLQASRVLAVWGTDREARAPCPAKAIAAAPPMKEKKAVCCQSCRESPGRWRRAPAACTAEPIRERHGETDGHPRFPAAQRPEAELPPETGA